MANGNAFPYTGCYNFDFTTVQWTINESAGSRPTYNGTVQLLINNVPVGTPITLEPNQEQYNGQPAQSGNVSVSEWSVQFAGGGDQAGSLVLLILTEKSPDGGGTVQNQTLTTWTSSGPTYNTPCS